MRVSAGGYVIKDFSLNKKHCLIISIICFIICLFCFSKMSFADTIIYGRYIMPSCGYESGRGAGLEYSKQIDSLEFRLYGDINSHKKNHADNGYTYHYSARGSWHFPLLYVGAGYGWNGYMSEFPDGAVWRKNSHSIRYHVGKRFDYFDLAFTYQPREDQTPNRVDCWALLTETYITERLRAIINIGRVSYIHRNERIIDLTMNVAIGLLIF